MLFSTTCKQGKLQVTDDGFLLVVQLFSKTPTWREPIAAIQSIGVQAHMIMRTIIVRTQGQEYQVDSLNTNDVTRLQALLPNVRFEEVAPAPKGPKPAKPQKPRYWWEDETKLTYIANYTKEKEMQQEVEAAYQHGWMLQGHNEQGGRISGSKVIAGAILAGPVGAMIGAKRGKDKTTLIFVRTPEWLASHQQSS